MTYEELLAQWTAGGGRFVDTTTNENGSIVPGYYDNGSSGLMMGPGGITSLTQNSGGTPGGLDVGSFYGAGGGSSPFQYQQPEQDITRELGLGLVGGAALGGLGLASGAFGAGAAGAAAPAVSQAGALTGAGSFGAELGALGAGGGALTAGGGALAAGGAGAGLLGAVGSAGSSLLSNPALLSAGLGAAAGALGGTQDTTQSSQSGLAPWQLPYAQEALARAQDYSNRPFVPYTGEGVAGFNPTQQNAFDQVAGRANSGDPLVNAARNQQANVIGGGMLNSNPYLAATAKGIGDRMGEAYATGTRGSLTSGAQMSGNDPRYSSAYQQNVFNSDRAFGDSLGQTMSGLYMGNYNQERGAQDTASRASLGFGQDARANTEGLLNVGNQIQGNQQDQLGFQRSQFDRLQNYPTQNLGILQNAINPAYGSQNQSTTPGVGAAQGAIGGALAGTGIYRSLYPQQGAQQPGSLGGYNYGVPTQMPDYFTGGYR